MFMHHRVAARFIYKVALSSARLRYIPRELRDGIEPERPAGTDLEIYRYHLAGKVYGVAFAGRADKPLWHHRFSDERGLQEHVDFTVAERLKRIQQKKDEMQAKREWQHGLKEGDILVSSWGYDQTNIDFYQVVQVLDKSVVIREIGKKVTPGHGLDSVMPMKDHFVGAPMRKMPYKDWNNGPGRVKINESSRAGIWDGRPEKETSTGYGH